MAKMAIFTIGANQFQIAKMTGYARDKWEFAGNYSENKRLMDDARAGRFTYLLVFDPDAIDEAVQRQLRGCGVQVICFRNQDELQRAADDEQRKKEKAERERKVRMDFEKDLAVIKL
jgi:hypothetical protein